MAIDFSAEKEVEKEPEYTAATTSTSELVTLYYKPGKSKVITVNISHLFPGRCTGIDQDGDTVNLTPAEIYNVLRTCELGRFQIRRKEEVKSLTGWQDSYLPEFGDYFFPGDFVTETVVEHYRNILPPVRMQHGLLMCDKEAIEVQKILPFLSDTWPLCRIGRAVIRASQSCRQSCNKSQCPACGCRSHHSCTHAPQFSRSFPAREWGSVLQRQGACGQCP